MDSGKMPRILQDIVVGGFLVKRFLSKVLILAGFLAAVAAGTAPAVAQVRAPATGDMVLGKADAPVTVIEYASMTCPHCATFHTEVLPKLKAAYIDTGKVKLIFREFPLDQLALRGAMLARCAGPERYFGYVDVLFRQQRVWSRSDDPLAALQRVARFGGMTDEEFRGCMSNEALAQSIVAVRMEGEQKHKIESTPTLIVGDKKSNGAPTFEELEAMIKPHLPKS
jgi:protein-disulfide isomerase